VIPILFQQFRHQYPTGALQTELLMVHEANYIARATLTVDGHLLVTGMAAALSLEVAEEQACERALACIGITKISLTSAPASNPILDPASAPIPGSISTLIPDPTSAPIPGSISTLIPDSTPAPIPGSISTLIPDSTPAPIPGSISTLIPEPTSDPIPNSTPSPTPNQPASAEPSLTEESMLPSDDMPIDQIPELSLEPEDLPTSTQGGYTQPASNLAATHLETLNDDDSNGPFDLSEIIAQIDVEMGRLGWGAPQGRTYLEQTFGKRSRQQLNDEELLAFLLHLESQ
jgi:hypothetical protein